MHVPATFSGSIGLAISQALLLTGMVQYGLKQTTEAIQQMTSAERILQYGDIEQVHKLIKIHSSSMKRLQNFIEFLNYYNI